MAMWFRVCLLYFFSLFEISSFSDSCAVCFLLVLGFWWVQKIFEGRGWKIWPRGTNSPFITWFCWHKLSLSSELCADKCLDVKVRAWCFMKYFDSAMIGVVIAWITTSLFCLKILVVTHCSILYWYLLDIGKSRIRLYQVKFVKGQVAYILLDEQLQQSSTYQFLLSRTPLFLRLHIGHQ